MAPFTGRCIGTRKVCPNWSPETMTCHSSNCFSIVWVHGNAPLVTSLPSSCYIRLQLFRERLSEKVHATTPKGIVGGFEFSVLQRSLKELARKAMEMCFLVLKASNKSRFGSYRRQEQCIDHIPHCLSGLSRAHFFPTTFLEIAVYGGHPPTRTSLGEPSFPCKTRRSVYMRNKNWARLEL